MFLGSSSFVPTKFVGSTSLIVLLSITPIFCAESIATAATVDEIKAAPTATASAGSTATSAQANAGPHGTARALAQAHSNECKAISDELVPDVRSRTSVMENENTRSAYTGSQQCQSDCNKAVQAINSVDRTHPSYMPTHQLPQEDVDRSIATCNSSYDTAIASYAKGKGQGSAGDATVSSTGVQGTGTASGTASTPQQSNNLSDADILLARERLDECKSIQLETKTTSKVPANKESSAYQLASQCATSCNAAWSSLSSAKHQVEPGVSNRTIEIHVSNCSREYELAVASYAEHQDQMAERDALVASSAGADAVANVLSFFAQHSTWDIQINGGDFSGFINERFPRHAKFNITEIEAVNYVQFRGGFLVRFNCAGGSNCIQLGDDRGDGLKFRDVHNVNINVGSTAGGVKSMDQVNAFGLDLERWAHSVGGNVDADFAN